ncbi:hypothetical protein ABIE50_006520 [Chitinophaga sp. OAE865]
MAETDGDVLIAAAVLNFELWIGEIFDVVLLNAISVA